MKKKIIVTTISYLLFSPLLVSAADPVASPKQEEQEEQVGRVDKKKMPENWGADQGQDIPLLDKEKEDKLDEVQAGATNLLYDTANWIDSFFDDERSLEEDNKTRATAKLETGYSRDGGLEVKPRLNVRLQLPKLSSRAHLVISGSDDEDFDIGDNPLNQSPGHNDEETGELTAALRFFLKESEKYNINVDTGMSWTYVFASLRYRAIQDIGNWQGRFTNRLRWYSDDGWENKVGYDLETSIGDNFFFRSSTSAGVYERTEGIPHGQTFKLFQVFSSLRAISYETGFYFGTDPEYIMTDAKLTVKYRQRFYRDWLVFEISPRINFPEDNDYEANPGLMFTFEATFGYDADKESYRKVFK